MPDTKKSQLIEKEIKSDTMKKLYLVLFCALSFSRIHAATCSSGQCVVMDEKAEHLFQAMAALDKAIDLASQIKNKDVRSYASKKIEAYKNDLQMHYLSNKFDNLSEEGCGFCENMNEVIAECVNGDLKTKIISTIQMMVEELEAAEKA